MDCVNKFENYILNFAKSPSDFTPLAEPVLNSLINTTTTDQLFTELNRA